MKGDKSMLIITTIFNILNRILDIIFTPVSMLMHGIDSVANAIGSVIFGLLTVLAVIIMLIASVLALPKAIATVCIPSIIFLGIMILMCITILT
jgi:hypothetical protein